MLYLPPNKKNTLVRLSHGKLHVARKCQLLGATKEGASPGGSSTKRGLEQVENGYLGSEHGFPKRSPNMAVRACRLLIPAGKGCQAGDSSVFPPSPNTNVLGKPRDYVDETPREGMEIVSP